MPTVKCNIVSFNPTQKTLTVRDPLTNHTFTLTLTNITSLTLKKQIELEQIPLNAPLKCYGYCNKIAHSIHLISIDIHNAHTDQYEPTWKNKDFIYATILKENTAVNILSSSLVGLTDHMVYNLNSDGITYAVTVDNNKIYQCPNIYTYQSCGYTALVAGCEAIVKYSKVPDGNILIGAEIHDFFPAVFPYYINKPGGTSGMSVTDIEANTRIIQFAHDKIEEKLDFLTSVDMQIMPALVNANESVDAYFKVMSDHLPPSFLTVQHNYLLDVGQSETTLPIEWHIIGQRHNVDYYGARVSLPSQNCGQYLVYFDSDVGGDIREFYRSYSVIDASYTICLYHVLSGDPPPEEQLHRLHIPFDRWHSEPFDVNRWANESKAEVWANVSRGHRQYGDNPTFLLDYAQGNVPFQVREDSEAVQSAALEALKSLIPLFKFQTLLDEFGHYTVGTRTIGLAKEQGYHTLTSLCTESHIDGHWAINHYGKPERPYFVGTDDFRKTGTGGMNGMVGFSQTQRHTYLARGYFCDFNPEPGNGGLLFGAGGRYCYDEIYLSRLLDFYDAMFQNAMSQTVPYVLQLGLEFGGYRPGAHEGNEMMVQYAIKKAKSQNVVFSTINAVSEYYRRHYSETPETSCYLTDFWAGFSMMGKPYLCPDVISFEGHHGMSLHMYGSIVPDYWYDYTKVWDYPDWGNEDIPRKRDEFGYMEPFCHDKYAVTPKIEDTRGVAANRTDCYHDGVLTITLGITAQRAWTHLPLALWDIPIPWDRVSDCTVTGGKTRFVGIFAPFTKNVNGMLICDVPPGETKLTITCVSSYQEPKTMDFCIDDALLGKVFTRESQSMAYLWNKRPASTHVTLTLSADQHADVYLTPKGIKQPYCAGTHTFTLLQGEWARVVGLSFDELKTALAAEETDLF